MKNITILILAIFVLSCSEDKIIPNVENVNIYEIKSNANDSIEKKRYEIFKGYDVSVYFNDTVAIIEKGNDYWGNPIYQIEKLDLAWSFDSYQDIKIDYKYIKEDSLKMEALNMIEEYLKSSSKALYPQTVLAVEKMNTTDQRNDSTIFDKGKFKVYFKTLLITNKWVSNGVTNGVSKDDFTNSVKLSITRQKINNFPLQLTPFGNISKSEWYGAMWTKLNPNIPENLKDPSFDMGGMLDQQWWFDWKKGEGYTDEQLQNILKGKRDIIAAFGFVGGSNRSSIFSPNDVKIDIDNYLVQMLRRSKKDFFSIYGQYPLVVKKANILYDILENEIGLKL